MSLDPEHRRYLREVFIYLVGLGARVPDLMVESSHLLTWEVIGQPPATGDQRLGPPLPG